MMCFKACEVLLYILIVLRECNSFKPFHIDEENRRVPPWTSYQYLENPATDHIIREYILQEQDQRTYLMCPKGFVIGQIGVALLLGQDQLERDEALRRKTSVFTYRTGGALPSDGGDRQHPSPRHPDDLCPTLAECLLYQACVFNFGNELCRKDPNPGSRKNIDTNITCVRDEALEHHLHNSDLGEDFFEKLNLFKIKRERVLNIMYDSKLDFGIEDFENTELKLRESEEEFVFVSGCPEEPSRAGYMGECGQLAVSNQTVSQNIWHLTSRLASHTCKDRVNQVYCSFQYSQSGKCVPPHLLLSNNNAWQHQEVFNDNAYPSVGHRPVMDINQHQQAIISYKDKNILPVRIGFALLVHKDVPTILNLLDHIYRSQHFYVIHVDKRKESVRRELMAKLRQRFPMSNVRVLPQQRSFITSWGSFGIVRAELELFEELCRLGLWDFILNMSGADLALRNVDDLSLALAPYRGQNFFAFHGNIRNLDLTKDQGLCWEAWYECDGFTYNVTRTAGQPTSETLEIKTTSQWATLSRSLVEHLLDQETHSPAWRTFDYHMQTSVIPDESYISTFAINSRMKSETHHVGLYWLKRFSGQTKYNLCKHLGDADFCGQGPTDIDKADMGEIADMSHRYFFARKFTTSDTNEESRLMVNRMSGDEYYKLLKKYIPKQILYQLMQNAFHYFHLQNGTNVQKHSWKYHLEKLHIFPVLHPSQPCCQVPFERHYKSIQEFSYVIDFTASTSTSVLNMRAKYDIQPQCFCYPRGHLRALRVTAWAEEGSDDKKALSINTPFPYYSAGSKSVFGEMWFHASESSINDKCKISQSEMIGEVAEIENIRRNERNVIEGDTLRLLAKLVDPHGNVRCHQSVEVTWDGKDLRDDVERAVLFTMSCGVMEAGNWKLTVEKEGAEKPYVYQVDMLFIHLEDEMSHLGPEPHINTVDLLQGAWSVDTVAQLPLPDFYNDKARGAATFPLELASGDKTKPAVHRLADTQHSGHSRHSRHRESRTILHILYRWITCSGGLVTLTLSLVFSYHTIFLPLRFPLRQQRRALYYSVLAVLATAILQSLLCSFYCDHQ